MKEENNKNRQRNRNKVFSTFLYTVNKNILVKYTCYKKRFL